MNEATLKYQICKGVSKAGRDYEFIQITLRDEKFGAIFRNQWNYETYDLVKKMIREEAQESFAKDE